MRSYVVLFLGLSAVMTGQTPPSFEVATVRPTAGPIPGVPPMFGNQRTAGDTLIIRHTPLIEIIRRGFEIIPQEMVGPDWLRTERYDITAKAAKPATDAELWAMIPQLLEERFGLKYHREPREVSGLVLTVGKNGHKLKPSDGGSSNFAAGAGSFQGRNVSTGRLAQLLSSVTQRPVKDETGLEGGYDFSMDLRSYVGQGGGQGGPLDLPGLAILAVQESMGLKLESRKFQIQVMIIDNIERQNEN